MPGEGDIDTQHNGGQVCVQNETTYVIRGTIQNAAGLFADISVTFVTKGKK